MKTANPKFRKFMPGLLIALAFSFISTNKAYGGQIKNFKAAGCNKTFCFKLDAPEASSGGFFANTVSFKIAKLTLVKTSNKHEILKIFESKDAYYDFDLGTIVLRSVLSNKNKDYIFNTQTGEIQEFTKISKL